MIWDPIEDLKRMHEEMDRLFGRVFSRPLLSVKGKELAPYKEARVPVSDIKETEKSVLANIELPGIPKEDIELNVTEDSIEVKAQQKAEKEIKEVEKIDERDKKIEELTETLQRLQAEFENYKKYIEKTKEEFVKYAKADIIEKLLPILDSFEMALRNTTDKEKFVKGVELIYSHLYSLLEKEGLKKIKAEGKFNPNLHEVLLKEESDKKEDIILEELQKGYMLNDKVLRHSKVKVSKCKSKEKQNLGKS